MGDFLNVAATETVPLFEHFNFFFLLEYDVFAHSKRGRTRGPEREHHPRRRHPRRRPLTSARSSRRRSSRRPPAVVEEPAIERGYLNERGQARQPI
ncbi:Transposase, IS5 family [Halalkaliarchaeum sp. AArc-CO]|nr:Transposase, IS5 family [Halalkaliarchaeum sp. AArc-CO]